MKPLRLARSQRGAAALFAAIGMIGMLVAAAFAIDVAQLHVARRELHNAANLAALDAARAAGGCLAPDQDRQAEANQAVLASLGRQGADEQWLIGGKPNLGRFVVTGDKLRVFEAATEEESREAYAFEVRLQRPFPNLLMPIPGADVSDATLSARSVAAMAPVASFSVGSFLLSVGPSEVALLNELFTQEFGQPIGIDVVSYQGLANSSVDLQTLADQLGVTTQELIEEPSTVQGLLGALADALFGLGEASAAGAVNTLAAAAPADPVILGDVIGSPQQTVVGVGEVALGSLDLVRALALASGAPVIALTPDITVPGVVDLILELTVGQIPQPAAGPATQDTVNNYLTRAQNTQGEINLALGLLPILGYAVDVDLNLVLAEADAELHEIRCANRSRTEHEVDIGVNTTVGRLVANNGPGNPLVRIPLSIPLLPLISETAICWEGSVNIADPESEELYFTGPFDPDDEAILLDNTQTVGSQVAASLAVAIEDLFVSNPPYICGPVGGLIDPIVSPVLAAVAAALEPALSGTIDPLLTPMVRSLGLSIGGADVTVRDVYVQPPALVVTE